MKDEALELAEKLERDFHEFYFGPQFYHSVAPTLISAAKKLREQHRQLEILDAVLFSPSKPETKPAEERVRELEEANNRLYSYARRLEREITDKE